MFCYYGKIIAGLQPVRLINTDQC